MSAVHVGQLTSEVVPEDEARPAPAADHDAEERLRELGEQLAADAARTHAEGFDD